MLTDIGDSLLIEAFPSAHRSKARLAGEAVAGILTARQWTERFAVKVEGERVLIPARLHFASEALPLIQSDDAWRLARALQTRSNDGFERQRAARDLLADLQPWSAPFIVALIGEYIVQILDDIAAALTPENARMLGTFIAQNQSYWGTTKRRVTSYWNAYYRSDLATSPRPEWARNFRPLFQQNEYVGFTLIKQLEAAAFGRE
jgi:hypothetical protein